MPQETGSKVKILMGVESVFKTAPAAGVLIPFNSCSIKPSRAKNTSKTMTGNLNPVEPFNGNLSISGSIVAPADSAVAWYLFQLAFGDPVITGTGPYVHTFKVGVDRPSFTLEEYFPGIDGSKKFLRYVGCKISKFSVSLGGDGELTLNFDIVAANYSAETSSFDADPDVVSVARLKNDQLAILEGASGITTCQGLDISVDFGLDTSQYCIGDGGTLGSIPDGIAAVSGTLKAQFADLVLFEKAVNSTESSLTATLTGGASSILAFKVPELQYSEDAPGIDGPQGLQIALPFVGYYKDAVEETALQVTLTNGDEHP